MTHASEPASVRDARMTAKKMSRHGAMTHQQALDAIARERGHRNWASFLKEERPSNDATVSPRTRSDRRAADIAETAILENAASTKQTMPWMPPALVPAASATLFVLGGTTMVAGVWGLAYAAAAGVIVLIAGTVARLSVDGMVATRRFVGDKVVAACLAMLLVSLVVLMGDLAWKGLGAFTDGISSLETVQGDWATTLCAIGITGLYASTRAHSAMALARPETVRPERTGDTVVAAKDPIAPAPVANAMLGLTLAGVGAAFVGLAGLVFEIVEMVASHGHVSAPMVGGSMGLIVLGGMIACGASFGASLGRPTPEMVIEDPGTRAARAKRFLGIGRRVRTD